ncbi:MAG: Hsp70 protein that interacts with Zuo1p [Thelocarpon impressellum]|nr:MAG: Hsp70 protein that interacts with Zuo1p [Thelocarpon impressellum]
MASPEADAAEPASAGQRTAIGLSFGNSNSSIARTSADGKAEVLANEEGDRQIPSTLSYIAGEEYHGAQAKSHLVRNPKNTVAYFRDFLGKDFKSIDPTACHASAHPQEHGQTVAFSVRENDEEGRDASTLSVSEITTRHLGRLASSASDFLGKKVDAAVVTVPTDFSEPQREALELAAKEAGVEVLQLIHEPVAAVLAYDARPDAKVADKMVVVADLGGTRSDVAVIASRGGIYTVLATTHDFALGGAQLDRVLVDYFAKEFVKKHKTDPRDDARSLAKLTLEAEATKKALSLGSSASLSVESLADGIDFSSTINRTRYELLGGKVFDAFTRLVEEAIKKAELDLLDVDEVILSGGTSHTPKIARLLQAKFPETSTVRAPSTSPSAINPSELAVRGAAIQASLIEEFDREDIEQSKHPMVTVTPHLAQAIGVLVMSADEEKAVFRVLLEAETAVPARRTAQMAAPKAGGDVLVKLCEASREIHVSRAEAKPRSKANTPDSDDSDDEEGEEEEEIKQKKWKVGKVLAEMAVRGLGKGRKVEVTASVGSDLAVQVTAREVGGKGGVRGAIAGKGGENGSA